MRTACSAFRRMPEAKIVYFLRNPIDRSWSSAAMHFRKSGDRRIEDVDDEAIRAYVLRKRSRLDDEYLSRLEAWASHYLPEQLLVGFFDDLVGDPRAFLMSVLAFLGADPSDDAVPADVDRRRNPRLGEKISDRYKRLFAELHIEHIRRLDEHFSNAHTKRWLEYARRCLEA